MNFYILKRILYFIPMSFLVVSLSAAMIHFIPGDPVDQIAGDFISEVEKNEIRKKLGLDKSLFHQILHYCEGVVHGDFGQSLIMGRSVIDLLSERALPSLELAVSAVFFSVVISIPLGILSALQSGKLFDFLCLGSSLIGTSMPNFWLGPLLVLFFSVHLGWLPVSGRTGLSSIVLPVITLSSSLSAVLIRVTRVNFLEQLHADYVRTARSKGLSEFKVLFKHTLKNSSISILTILSSQFGTLITGTIITEKVFSWPGLGILMTEAIERRDYPVVQGCLLVFSFTFLLNSLLTDLLYFWLDPRIRTGKFS